MQYIGHHLSHYDFINKGPRLQTKFNLRYLNLLKAIWLADMARTYEFVQYFVRCDTMTMSPNQIIIILLFRFVKLRAFIPKKIVAPDNTKFVQE